MNGATLTLGTAALRIEKLEYFKVAVRPVVEAMANTPLEHDVYYREWQCPRCNRVMTDGRNHKDFKHKLDCPVLLSRQLLKEHYK
jgi:hypothetical protein